MKKILFIMDELDSISPLKDTTYLFMLECQNRGYEIYYSLIDELFFDSILYADCLKVEMEEQILSESVDRKIYNFKGSFDLNHPRNNKNAYLKNIKFLFILICII